MTEGSIRNAKIGCGAFALLFFGSIYAYYHFAQRRMIEHAMGRAGAPVVRDESPQLQQLRQNEGRDPAAALKIADDILAQSKSEPERRYAQSRLPTLLHYAASRQLQAGRRDAAEPFRARLEKTFPDSDPAKRLRVEWRQSFAREAAESLRAGTLDEIEAKFRTLWAQGPTEAERAPFQQWNETLQRRWREARAAQQPGADAIREMLATIIADGQQTISVGMQLADVLPAARPLAERGDALAAGDKPHAALAFWQAALVKANQGERLPAGQRPPTPQERDAFRHDLRIKLASGWIALGEKLEKGERPEFVLLPPREAYEAAVRSVEGFPGETDALVKLLDHGAKECAALASPVLQVRFVQLNGSGTLPDDIAQMIASRGHEVRAKIHDALRRQGARLWQCCLELPEFNPWGGVPAAVREAIDEPAAPAAGATAAPPGSETERRRKLAAHYRDDFLHIPMAELEPFRAVLHPVMARWGLITLKGNAEEAFTMLREVLRHASDAKLKEELAQTLRFRISRSRQENDFNQFYLLAGFYAGELGLPAAGDHFREDFRQGLQAAAAKFKPSEPMKYIFILSLTAQCFPEEPLGKQARDTAFATAFASVPQTESERKSAPLSPSPLAGYSVELINNSTDHHLLLFYRGADNVSVHQWPWRRGTVVVPDGNYEYVVLSPANDIRPYRSQATLRSSVRAANYVIQTTGGSRNQGRTSLGILAGGDFKLLYAPAAAGVATIEPRSGLPKSGKRGP